MLTDDYLLACSELNLSLWLCCYRDVEGGAYIRLLRWDERLSTCLLSIASRLPGSYRGYRAFNSGYLLDDSRHMNIACNDLCQLTLVATSAVPEQ